MHIDLQLQLVHQDDHIKVELDKRAKFIFVEWLKPPTTEQFRQSFELATTISSTNKCAYWLSDSRQIPYLDFADQNWVLRAMKPVLKTSSLMKFARISLKESIGLMDIHRIFNGFTTDESLHLSTKLESFTNKEAALDWLFSEFGKENPSEANE
ncbi:hypothetical protein [Rufibacter sp. XAAS-G3-1]|uniref:hypothetical protein n=1 Tax=Rufibacter sp. XAAS-G3-1 TaxID=2729134 RepID=UPI0015E7D03E|nr:hypothetical protein [Rufibacter sp. XAAS-G3-1]